MSDKPPGDVRASVRTVEVGEADEGRSTQLYDLEGVLGPTVIAFVERHVSSLLAWDILVFFHRNPDAVLDVAGLAARLGRKVDEVEPEVEILADGRILQYAGGLIRYRPTPELRLQVGEFVDACQDRGRRLALIALVLHRIGRAEA
jgi:hypothetical protein